jgi:hypothetical protein
MKKWNATVSARSLSNTSPCQGDADDAARFPSNTPPCPKRGRVSIANAGEGRRNLVIPRHGSPGGSPRASPAGSVFAPKPATARNRLPRNFRRWGWLLEAKHAKSLSWHQLLMRGRTPTVRKIED